MLLANRTVAEKIGKAPKGKKPKVLPYRIHDLPDPEKLDNLAPVHRTLWLQTPHKRNQDGCI